MKIKFLLFCALALLSIQITFAQTPINSVPVSELKNVSSNESKDEKPEMQRAGYLVGPGDTITGKVLNEPQFDFVARIGEDGKFQVPFFDKTIMAKCRTEKELRSDVTQLLSKYLKSPLVSVSVSERKSRQPAIVYGEVRQAQKYEFTARKYRLLELLAMSGGVTEKAGGEIQIFHTQPPLCEEAYEDGTGTVNLNSDNLQDFPYRLYSLSTVEKGTAQSNPVIYPGDIVVVKEAPPVYVLGETNSVGKVIVPEGGLTLTQAVANMGGIRSGTKVKEIKIYRMKPNSKEKDIISVNYDAIKKGTQKDVMLSPYDIVEVGKAKKSITEELLDVVKGAGKSVVTSLPVLIL